MDFELNSEHESFRKTFQKFIQREISPLVERAEEKEEFPVELFKKMGSQGYLCITCPEKYGGAALDKMTECIYTEEIARVNLGICISLIVHSAFSTNMILEYGNEEQRQRYLPDAIRGDKIWAFAGSESEAGWDRTRIQTTATKDGSNYILNGTKLFITNATFSDNTIVEAYTDKKKGLRGLSLFIVPKGTPGFTVAKKMKKAGVRSSEIAEIVLNNCRLPAENLLGEEGGAHKKIMGGRIRVGSWILVGARAIGVARTAFEASLEHAKNRVQFNRPIGHFQANSFKLARMALDLEAARLLLYKAAWLLDNGKECYNEAAMAKLFATEMAVRITGEAVQIHGAHGYMMESPIQRYFRDAKMLTITEASSEILHILIGRELSLKGDDWYPVT